MKIRELIRTVFAYPVTALPGDTIELQHRGKTLVKHGIDKTRTFDEGVIFEVEDYDGKTGLGGAVLDQSEDGEIT